MATTVLLTLVAALLVGWGALIFTLASRGGNTLYDPEVTAMCAPARYDSLTGQPADAPRRIIAQLAPPAGWREAGHVAITPAPAVVKNDDLGDPDELDDWDDDDGWDDDESEELPIAAPDWPTKTPAAIESEPVYVPVNRTAARFAALEVTHAR
jgi:hypothetical protein